MQYNVLIGMLFVLMSIAAIVILNYRTGLIFSTGDYHYHVNRIQALVYSFQHGNFLPKVDGYFSGGYGYASSMFYPDIFLYPAAILKLLGVSLTTAYLVELVLINFVTLVICYWAGKRLDFSTRRSLLFTSLYFLGAYRLQVLFSRQDVGELLGMMFLPLILSEMIRFKNDTRNHWYVLAFAIFGLAMSHLISLVMAITFMAMFVLLNFQSFFKLKIIASFAKAAVLDFGLVAWFYLPLIEQALSQKFTLSTDPLVNINNEKLPLNQLVTNSLNNQVFHASTVNLGLVIFLGLVVYTMYNFWHKENLSLTIIALSLFFACTQYFPWNFWKGDPLKMIQFPWRFFSIISLIVAYFIAKDDLHLMSIKYFKTALVLGLLLFSFDLSQDTVQASAYDLKTYSSYNELSSFMIGAGHEYLPSKVDYNEINSSRQLQYNPKNINIDRTTINDNEVKFNFSTKKENSAVVLPLFYYKGYQATMTGNGKATTPMESSHGLVKVVLKGKGSVLVQYHYTLVQKLSLLLSFFTAIGGLGYVVFKKKFARIRHRVINSY